MQAARVAVGALSLIMSATASASTPLPAIKYVQSDDAVLRAGPASEFYVTQRLSWGSKVEAYKQVDGWSAIRPLENSFSWVEASSVEVTADASVGLITSDGVFTRVGSNEGDRRDAEYVQLNKGEFVEILGVETTPEQNGSSRKWYKIAPPSGEFRWIESVALADRPVNRSQSSNSDQASSDRDLSPPDESDVPDSNPPSLVTGAVDGAHRPDKMDPATTFSKAMPIQQIKTKPIPSSKPASQPSKSVSSAQSGSQHEASANSWSSRSSVEPTSFAVPLRDSRVAKASAIAPVSTTSAKMVPATMAPATTANRATGTRITLPRLIASASKTSSSTAASVVAPTAPPSKTSLQTSEPILDQLADLSIELSAIVSGDISNWELGFVRSQTQYLLTKELSNETRDRASTLLDRIDRYADVKLRFDKLQQATIQAATPVSYVAQTSADKALLPHPANPRRSRALQMLSRAVDSIAPVGQNSLRPAAFSTPTVDSAATLGSDVYAGTGFLMPVYSARSGLPRYALTDNDGTILTFVSPKSGLNLSRYLRQKVGIIGDSNHVNRIGSPHLLADRVVVLDRLR